MKTLYEDSAQENDLFLKLHRDLDEILKLAQEIECLSRQHPSITNTN